MESVFVETTAPHRRADQQDPSPTQVPSASPSTSLAPTDLIFENPIDGETIFGSIIVFGWFFVIALLLYSVIRTRYPRVYNIRAWAESCRTELADNLYGYCDWMWKLAWISDEDMIEECGLDSLCFIRVYWFGFKVSLLGVFNSFWLFPIYATAEVDYDEKGQIQDDIFARLSVANVPSGSFRFYATVLASYLMFFFTMYWMLKELKWFTEQRDAWLMEAKPRNYAVYVTGIPPEYRTSARLLEYFRSCFHYGDVIEARIALRIPTLESKVEEREKVLAKLEHAINIENASGRTPMLYGSPLGFGEEKDAITVYSEELTVLNNQISRQKEALLTANDPNELPDQEDDKYTLVPHRRLRKARGSGADGEDSVMSSLSGIDANAGVPVVGEVVRQIVAPVTTTVGLAEDFANAAVNLVVGPEEGDRRESGFVTFSKLSARSAAVQMVHHPIPFTMDVFEAPDPDDIFWPNAGRSNEDLQAGMLLSVCLTAVLLILWTIPTAFVVSLTNVNTLAEEFSFLKTIIDDIPWLGDLLAVMAPLLLIPLKNILKIFLRRITKFEGPISNAVLEASLFIKLSVFMIVNTYFVSIIAGSVTDNASSIVESVSDAVTLLAESLPSQATYFLTILIMQTSLGLSFELLRVRPLFFAFLRKFMPPRLSEKERNKTIFFGILRPLSDPRKFEHADNLSQTVLYWMILLGYSASSPFVNWFLAFCFMLLAAGYRNQFVYCYPVTDSGGRMFMSFMRFVPVAMIIAELSLTGYLGLKKAPIPAALMAPIILFTILFYQFIGQRHYRVFNYLPSRECVTLDNESRRNGRADLAFVKDQYLQPALRAKDDVQAENMSVAQEIRHTGANYVTPPGSEAELESINEEDSERSSLVSKDGFGLVEVDDNMNG